MVWRLLASLALAILVCGPFQAGAQTPAPPADLEKQYDAAFQEMLRKPADLDVLFRFATLATQTGDLEGAISALERMLLINPDLPRVRLELGVLYYRLGSYEVARTYLEAVLRSQSLPPEVREKAQQFMSEVVSRLSPARLTGEVFFGWRYQSNANLGPSTSNVRLFGQTANLNQSSVGAPDWGVVAAGTARHFFDFGEQDKSGLETNLTVYASRQFTLNTANLHLVDFTIGPRFQLFPGSFEEVMLRPFISAGHIWVNDAAYYGSYGGGIEASVLLATDWRATATALWRRHDHLDNWYLQLNSAMRGHETSGTLTLQYAAAPWVALFATGSASRYSADVTPSQSYFLWGAGGGVTVRFTDPLFETRLPWTISLAYTYQTWSYDQPDIVVDPTARRYQSDNIINLTLAIPFDDRTTLTISGGRFVRSAEIPNYAFDNNNVMVGVSWRF